MPDDSFLQPTMNPPPYFENPTGANPHVAASSQQGYPMTEVHHVTYPQTTTIIHGPTVIVADKMGPNPTPHFCTNCNQQIITNIQKKPSMKTHVCAGLLCFFLCWPCVCVPYCMDTFHNVEHYCPDCKMFLGSYTT